MILPHIYKYFTLYSKNFTLSHNKWGNFKNKTRKYINFTKSNTNRVYNKYEFRKGGASWGYLDGKKK